MKFIKTFESFDYSGNNYPQYEQGYIEVEEDDLENADRGGYLKAFSKDLYYRLLDSIAPNKDENDIFDLVHDNYFSYLNYNKKKEEFFAGTGTSNEWVYSAYSLTDNSFIFVCKDSGNIKYYHCSNYLNLIKCIKDKGYENF
jgi:hypothetical protein